MKKSRENENKRRKKSEEGVEMEGSMKKRSKKREQ